MSEEMKEDGEIDAAGEKLRRIYSYARRPARSVDSDRMKIKEVSQST